METVVVKKRLESIKEELKKLSARSTQTIFDRNIPNAGFCGKCGKCGKACCDYDKD